jgi:molecular chaperone HscB
MIQCRNCGAGATPDAHFCPQCERILPLARQTNFFAFFGLPRDLTLDPTDLEQRFRALSRQFHPDYFYNAPAAERRASLERSSYLNDAYRTLKEPVARIEYLLGLEGLAPTKGEAGIKVPAALLQEVFALNETLDEIRESREAGLDPDLVRARLAHARAPIDRKREDHEHQLSELSADWDARHEQSTLTALRERLLERNYLRNLLATIDREMSALDSGAHSGAAPAPEPPRVPGGAQAGEQLARPGDRT